jgi:hypothetical protein
MPRWRRASIPLRPDARGRDTLVAIAVSRPTISCRSTRTPNASYPDTPRPGGQQGAWKNGRERLGDGCGAGPPPAGPALSGAATEPENRVKTLCLPRRTSDRQHATDIARATTSLSSGKFPNPRKRRSAPLTASGPHRNAGLRKPAAVCGWDDSGMMSCSSARPHLSDVAAAYMWSLPTHGAWIRRPVCARTKMLASSGASTTSSSFVNLRSERRKIASTVCYNWKHPIG